MRYCRQLLLVIACSLLVEGCASTPPNSLARHNSSKWTNAIAAFGSSDLTNPPPHGCVVFTGSSYIKRWTTLAGDFPGVPVINRGFGGCQLADVWAFADRMIIPYAPRQVVIYAGGNDINAGKSPEVVCGDFIALATKLRAALPGVNIVFISCPPSPKRWEQTGRIKQANALIEKYCRQHDIAFVNTFDLMLGMDGKPKPDIYADDRLHMNAAGYAIWREAVKPCLK